VISANCNGHIGALSVSVRGIVQRFHHSTTGGNSELLSVKGHGLALFTMLKLRNRLRMQAYLVRCLMAGPIYVPPDIFAAYRQLVRSALLEETANGEAKFASPAAASYLTT